MSNEHEKTEYGAAGWDTPPSEEDYTLEEILAEYGSSRQQKILEEVEQALQPPEESTSAAEPESEPPAPPKSAKELWEERMGRAPLPAVRRDLKRKRSRRRPRNRPMRNCPIKKRLMRSCPLRSRRPLTSGALRSW